MQLVNKYRQIDLATWKRRQHFELFARGEYPYDGLTTHIDVTRLLSACREADKKFFTAMLHVVTDAMNTVENFRYRIFEDQVVLCEKVDPSFNVLNPETELYYFAEAPFQKSFAGFDRDVEKGRQIALETNFLVNNRLDIFHASSLPWFGFTDIIQPMGLSVNGTIPRVVCGRYRQVETRIEMPFSITCHHGFVDGIHAARLLERMRELMEEPAFLQS